MAEPQPGRPGGSGSGGTRSATAATFVVNDASLRDLRRTWQGLTQDVKNFNAELSKLRTHERDIERLGAKLGALGGVGGAGGGPGGAASGRARNGGDSTFSGQPAGGQPAGGGGSGGGTPAPTPSGGGGGRAQNGGDSRFSVGNVVGAGVVASGLAAGYYTSRMGGISDNDLMYNQLAQASGQGYSRGAFMEQRRAITGDSRGNYGIGGYQSMEDLNQGVTTVTRAVGGTATTGRAGSALREAGQLAGLTPNMGLAGSSQALAGLYTAQSSTRIQAATGTSSIGVGGGLTGGTQVYDNILRTVFRGQPHTAAQITEGMVPGAPLQRTLDYLLPDPATQEQFRQYALAKANLGGSSSRVQNALTGVRTGKTNADTTASGLRDTIRGRQNEAGGAAVRAATEAGVAGKDGLQNGFSALQAVTDALTDSFRTLNNTMGGAPGDALGFNAVIGGGQVQSVLGALGGVGGALFAGQAIGGLFGRRRRRGGGGGGGGGGGNSGAGGLLDGDVQKVFVVNQCCDGNGNGAGGFGDGPDGPDGGGRGRGRGGRGARMGRFARAAARPAAAAVAGAAVWKGADWLSDKAEEKWGQRDENGDRSLGDRLGKSAATVGKYAAGGAAAGAVLGGPVGAVIGGAIGTGVGSVKSIYDWYWGSNKKNDGREKPKGEVKPEPPKHGYFSPYNTEQNVPRMSRGGKVGGNHTEDVVPILATPGEVVVPLPVVSRHGGAEKLMKLLGIDGVVLGGQGRAGKYKAGGPVSADAAERRGNGAYQGEVTGDTEGMHPEFMRRLKAWSAAVGKPYNIGSGYRSIKEQQRLYDRWMRRVPGQAPAAKPGSSNHNFGLASDGPHWRSKNPEAHGLRYPMSYEPWHVEPVNAKAMRNGAPMASGEDTAQGGKEAQSANGVGGSPLMAMFTGGGGGYKSELEALGAILSGNNSLGAAVRSISSVRGAAAPEPGTSTASSTPAPAAPQSAGGAVALGQQKAAARGWTGNEWDSLYQLWQKESGWNPNAVNPTSSARGIPQAMMSAHFGKGWKNNPEAKAWLADPGKQIDWGLNYIAGRYKSPSRAWDHSKKHNWYEKGAIEVLQDEVAQLHQGEMVVPKNQAIKLRSMIQQSRRMAMESGGGAAAAGGVSRSVTLAITAPVTIVGKATPEDARSFLEMVKDEAERTETLDYIGAG